MTLKEYLGIEDDSTTDRRKRSDRLEHPRTDSEFGGDGDAGGDRMTVRYNGDFLGVKCDACGRIFWTNYQGQSFPQHIRDAKENGWIHKKLGDRWKDFCPDCHEYELQKRRETYFKREDDK